MGKAIEECGGHLGVAEDAWPFTECEVRGDDHRGLLVKLGDEVEEQLAAGLGEGQVAKLVEDDEVEAGQMIGDTALTTSARLRLELVHEIDNVKEATSRTAADASAGRKAIAVWVLPVPVPPMSTTPALLLDEAPGGEVAHQRLIDVGGVEVLDILGEREFGNGELVLDGARLFLVDLRREEIADAW